MPTTSSQMTVPATSMTQNSWATALASWPAGSSADCAPLQPASSSVAATAPAVVNHPRCRNPYPRRLALRESGGTAKVAEFSCGRRQPAELEDLQLPVLQGGRNLQPQPVGV